MRRGIEEVWEFFWWALEVFSRRDCGLILAGLRLSDSEWRANEMLKQLERRRLIHRDQRGGEARFSISPEAIKAPAFPDPRTQWRLSWDGKWRVFTYDVAECNRRQRICLWRALRARNVGRIQRSVYVWPHNVEKMLAGILRAKGMPECFCGFTSERLFLCSDSEVVNSAWNFRRIDEAHREYLRTFPRRFAALDRANDWEHLVASASDERESFRQAFSLDPLLPQKLWPPSYIGEEVDERHSKFLRILKRRLKDLAHSRRSL